jgi:V8-like Glu-specific endopeptidase
MKAFYFLISLFLFLEANSQSFPDVKKTVAFVYLKDSLGNFHANGSSFLIKKNNVKDSTKSALFLVTAKHVLQDAQKKFYKEVYLRLNTSDTSSRYVYCKLEMNVNLIIHHDTTVDLAIILFTPQKNDYAAQCISDDIILEKDKYFQKKINEGTRAYFAGLFTPFEGRNRIYPILRFGHIALIANEKVKWVFGNTEMIFVEMSSFGGNSGSPVFFEFDEVNGGKSIILGGILSGTFRDLAEVKVIENNSTQVAIYNNGITGVVPAYYLKELLNTIKFAE